MFSGIVDRLGVVEKVERTATEGRVFIRLPKPWPGRLMKGESIAVNGVCLTLTGVRGRVMRFDVLDETFRKTNLGAKQPGQVVNLERSLRLGDTIGGHFVTGHVDGTGTLRAVTPVGRDWIIHVQCPDRLMGGLVPKGSVSLDGISLTVVDVLPDGLTVHIIPHTWTETDLSRLRIGDAINVELDMLGKYVQRAVAASIGPARQRRAKR